MVIKIIKTALNTKYFIDELGWCSITDIYPVKLYCLALLKIANFVFFIFLNCGLNFLANRQERDWKPNISALSLALHCVIKDTRFLMYFRNWTFLHSWEVISRATSHSEDCLMALESCPMRIFNPDYNYSL